MFSTFLTLLAFFVLGAAFAFLGSRRRGSPHQDFVGQCTRQTPHECGVTDSCNGLPKDWHKFHAENVAKLDPAKRAAAVEFLRFRLGPDLYLLRQEIARNPQEWWVDHHHLAMMGVRNALRQNGFGEKELGIDNLDDYAVGLVELAAQ